MVSLGFGRSREKLLEARGGALGDCPFRIFDSDKQRGIYLQASPFATGAELIAMRKRDMTEFTGIAVMPSEKTPVDNHSQPDSPTHVDHHNISQAFCSTEMELSNG